MKKSLAVVVIVVFAITTFGQDAKETKNAVYGEIGCGNMYHGFDVGGSFYPSPTCKMWINFDRKIGKKFTVSVGTWMQRSAVEPPKNGADEIDAVVTLTYQINEKTSFTAYAGNYTVPNLNIQKFSGTVARNFSLKKVPLTFTNETALFTTTRPSVAKGGFVNKVGISTSRALTKTATVSGRIAASGDNGPFGLGGPAIIGFVNGRIEQKISKNFSLFLNARYSRPIVGNTNRVPIFSADSGVAFRFDF